MNHESLLLTFSSNCSLFPAPTKVSLLHFLVNVMKNKAHEELGLDTGLGLGVRVTSTGYGLGLGYGLRLQVTGYGLGVWVKGAGLGLRV